MEHMGLTNIPVKKTDIVKSLCTIVVHLNPSMSPLA